MKYIKVPTPTRLLFGAALAYWLAGIISPAFVAIAAMIIFFIPIFYNDYLSADIADTDVNRPKKSGFMPDQSSTSKKEAPTQQLKLASAPASSKKDLLTK